MSIYTCRYHPRGLRKGYRKRAQERGCSVYTKGGWSGGSSRITATRPEFLRSSVWLSSIIPRRDLVVPDGKPAPPPLLRVRRFWTEAEPPDPATLHDALPHADLRHACVLGSVVPTVVSHAIVPLPAFGSRPAAIGPPDLGNARHTSR